MIGITQLQSEMQRLSKELEDTRILKDEIERENEAFAKKNLMQMEELKLLKDFVYGLDSRSKDVHMYKFMNGRNHDDQQQNDQD